MEHNVVVSYLGDHRSTSGIGLCSHLLKSIAKPDQRVQKCKISEAQILLVFSNFQVLSEFYFIPCSCELQRGIKEYYIQFCVLATIIQQSVDLVIPNLQRISTKNIQILLDPPIAQKIAIESVQINEIQVHYLFNNKIVPNFGKCFIDGTEFNIKNIFPESNSKYFRVSPSTRIEQANSLQLKIQRSADDLFKQTGYSMGSESEMKMLYKIFGVIIDWQKSFPNSPFVPTRGVLLKGNLVLSNYMVATMAKSFDAKLQVVNANDIFGIYMGDSEANLRAVFENALVSKDTNPVSIIFIDQIEAICSKRESMVQNNNKNRIVGQLLTLMDGLNASTTKSASKIESALPENMAPVVIVASTIEPNLLDEALRRAGRFDHELWIGTDLQGETATTKRLDILTNLTSKWKVSADILELAAGMTVGFVGEDLEALCREALLNASARHIEDVEINLDDFTKAIAVISPSNKRSITREIPKVKWDDIGGLESVKLQLRKAVEWPLKYPEQFKKLNLKPSRGILLYGPPGCCKTTLVKAAAASVNASFISISGADIYSPYFGQAETMLRETFKQARMIQPCTIFIDEIEAIVGKRQFGDESSGVQQRILSTILNELDGIGLVDGQTDTHVMLVAATNRPDMIDEALLRPGRIDHLVYVPKPSLEERIPIFKVKCANIKLHPEIGFLELALLTENFSGADIENLCREAAICALRQNIHAEYVEMGHFRAALEQVSLKLQLNNEELYSKFLQQHNNN